jgi:hypothetical protein
LRSISGDPQVQGKVNVGDKVISDDGGLGDVAVPAFELAIVAVVLVMPAWRATGFALPRSGSPDRKNTNT